MALFLRITLVDIDPDRMGVVPTYKVQLFLKLHSQLRKTRVWIHRLYDVHGLRNKCSLASNGSCCDERGEGCGGENSCELHDDVEDNETGSTTY